MNWVNNEEFIKINMGMIKWKITIVNLQHRRSLSETKWTKHVLCLWLMSDCGWVISRFKWRLAYWWFKSNCAFLQVYQRPVKLSLPSTENRFLVLIRCRKIMQSIWIAWLLLLATPLLLSSNQVYSDLESNTLNCVTLAAGETFVIELCWRTKVEYFE